jgi:hypothetical protein
MNTGYTFCRHHPPPGRRNAPPDDKLQPMIQYAAALVLDHRRPGVPDRPVKPGDDGYGPDYES